MHHFHRDGDPAPDAWVFVFGSNLAGRHGAGAAKAARLHYGAVYGIGSGRTGMAYAIPTKDHSVQTLPLVRIEPEIRAFIQYARENPGTNFWVTRIGCGLAGYRDEQMAPLFSDAPQNCSLPFDWKAFVATKDSAPLDPIEPNGPQGALF